jgi:hypothetical protein
MKRTNARRCTSRTPRSHSYEMVAHEGATGNFVTNHPWMSFFIILAGISTVGAVLGANRG